MKKSSVVIILLMVFHMMPLQAGEELNNKKFVELSEGQRHWYFIGAHSAISHMIGMESQEQSKCVLDWFFNDTEKNEATLLKNIKHYPDYSPTTIILASLRRACNILPKK